MDPSCSGNCRHPPIQHRLLDWFSSESRVPSSIPTVHPRTPGAPGASFTLDSAPPKPHLFPIHLGGRASASRGAAGLLPAGRVVRPRSHERSYEECGAAAGEDRLRTPIDSGNRGNPERSQTPTNSAPTPRRVSRRIPTPQPVAALCNSPDPPAAIEPHLFANQPGCRVSYPRKPSSRPAPELST